MSTNTPSASRNGAQNPETSATAALNGQYESREIPLELIDPPANAERETMEETDLAALAESIRDVGLIKPIVLKPVGTRYEVIAGHRRFIACGLVNYSPVPCRVKVRGDVDPLALLVAENAHTEAVNPVEEARFYERVLVELCDNDVDLLVLKIRRRRDYLEDRLNLLRGDPMVIDALANKRISLAVARELNRVHDPQRLLVFLDVATTQGATARQVAEWRRDADLQGVLPPPPETDMGATGDPNQAAHSHSMQCVFCGGTDFPSQMRMLWVHNVCEVILNRMLGKEPGAGAGQV
jgi:ParB family chromosome partitioning protein